MTIESDVANLVAQNATLMTTVNQIVTNLNTSISNAVATSQNASQIPLVQLSTNFINSQAALINYVRQRP